jgi:L-ascorbate metabolism protein UlaG (beta-lactamase superfamily)
MIMKNKAILLLMAICMFSANANQNFESDTLTTSGGELIITFIGHGSLMMEYNDKTIHIDPVSREADYSVMPKADLVLVTHHHGDHLDSKALSELKNENTKIIGTETCKNNLENFEMETMQNGEEKKIMGLIVKAVAAYNVEHKRSNGKPYHLKGEGNGYIITFDGFKVYIAGDTENTKEMKALKNIDVAFLPMNLPYSRDGDRCCQSFQAKDLIPISLQRKFFR